MANIRLWLCFDGTDFHGYQRQKNGYTVQEAIEEAIEKITGFVSPVIGCSRTDAGVHAKRYCANFLSNTHIPMEKMPLALNTALPESIRILKSEYVPNEFHATFSAKEKTYEYLINTNKIANPFLARYCWHFAYNIQLPAMRDAADLLLGTHDFSAFMASGGQTKTTVRTVKSINLTEDDGVIRMQITADGFLYNMVRIITGTLVYCGIGKLSVEKIGELLKSGDRSQAGITAPPQGLSLLSIVY